jgi:hypothetical protein
MNHNLKEKMLPECYEYSLNDVAEKMFLTGRTVSAIEKRATESFKQIFATRGIDIKDLLP